MTPTLVVCALLAPLAWMVLGAGVMAYLEADEANRPIIDWFRSAPDELRIYGMPLAAWPVAVWWSLERKRRSA